MGASVMSLLANYPNAQREASDAHATAQAQLPGVVANSQNLQIQAQQAQRQLLDQKVFSDAFAKSGGDWGQTVKAVMADPRGISPQGFFGLQNEHMALQKGVSEIAAKDAETGAKHVETLGKYNDLAGAALEAWHGLPADQQAQAWPQLASKLQGYGFKGYNPQQPLDENGYQLALGTHNYYGKTLEQAKTVAETGKAKQEQATSAATQAKTEAETPGVQAHSLIEQTEAQAMQNLAKNPNSGWDAIDSIFPKGVPGNDEPNKRYKDMFNQALGMQGPKGALDVIKQANEEKKTIATQTNPLVQQQRIQTAAATAAAENPAKIAAAQIEAQNRTEIQNSVEGRQKFEKSAQELITAQAADHQLQAMIAAARAGNKAAGSNLPLVGVETLNAINGIKRINGAEIAQYQGAGNLLDQIQGKIGKLTTGQPIPADVLNDIQNLHKTLSQGAEQKHANDVNLINQLHHTDYKPFKTQYGEQSGTVNTREQFNALPSGAVYTGKDGKQYRKP